ncbi:MAG TPA: DNA polymerase [Candidatus Paceibacterota bacterium]|nr:DNA polymerase [Candidatus Paceibacterota bacterium]
MTKKKNKTLVLLDAHAIIHRAYHALPAFTNTAGEPTGALYGLTTMLLRIITDLKPDYLVAAYDLPKPTFRHQAYEAYKGTRVKADDELKAQLTQSREVFDAFGIPHIDAEGFEADDVIGTLVEKFKKEKDLTIIIASGDMDTLQLVEGNRVQVFTLKKGITDTILYTQAAVEERYGFSPKLLVDYKGLRGDPSDNIIGIKGVGEKTATTLVATFGTLESLYKVLKKNPEQVKAAGVSDRMVELLKEHESEALFSKTLATIRRDVPITYTLPEQPFKEMFDSERALALCAKFEFRSLIPRMKNLFASEQEKKNDPETIMIHADAANPLVREAAVALWVLHSDYTNPTLDDILLVTKKETLADAYAYICAELDKQGLCEVFEQIEKPIISLVEEMEQNGVLIDREHFARLATEYQKTLARLETDIHALAGVVFNINSPKQMSEVLFTALALKPKGKRKESGAYTTNAETLESLRDEHPIIPKILEYREYQKLLSTYILTILEKAGADNRLHAKFLQNGTTTGRFSSVDPNLQNLPMRGEQGKTIRRGFIAPAGWSLLSCDYAQIELRCLAILSQDEKLIASFQGNDDVHATVASYMFKIPVNEVTGDMRRKAKVINFVILYGMGVSALQKNLNTSRAEAQQFYNEYFATFPAVAAYLESSKEAARTVGYTKTYFGRKRSFPQINSKLPFLRALAERTAMNAPIQGTSADIIKLAIGFAAADIDAAGLADSVKLTMQIHDELVYEVKEEVKEQAQTVITRAMEGVFERSWLGKKEAVPLRVSASFGRTLGDVK